MAQKGYLIGPQLVAKIKDTISRVEGSPYGGGATEIPTRFETVPGYVPKPIRIAAYPRETFWRKNEVQQVTFYTHNGTQYGLATLDASGTATAVNICNDLPPVPAGIDDPRLGPTPTMTWCVTSPSRGGANVVVDGPQAGTFVAAYPTSQGEWGTDQTRTVAYYYRNGTTGAYQPTGFTATAINVGSPYKPLSAGGSSGPTPTMAWCVVAAAPDGGLVAVEAQAAPETQWANINPSTIGEPWQRTSSRSVTLPGSGETVNVVSAFDYYSPLDLPFGLVYTKAISPSGGGATANVVIGPPPVPLHSVRYESGSEWKTGESRTLTVLPSAGITQQRSVTVTNPYYDSIMPGDKPLAIGKVGTAYHVITAPEQAGVNLGQRTEFGDKDTPWNRTSTRTVRLTGTTSVVQVYSLFDTYTNLDTPFGLAFSKAKDPLGGEGTAYVAISPPPVPIHSVSTTQSGSWARNEQRVMDVLPSHGITQTRTVNVSNPYFDSVQLDSNPMAIGKVGTAFHLITAPSQPGVIFADRSDSDQWERGSQRSVKVFGSTATANAYNFVGHYESFDGRGTVGMPGLALGKGPELSGGAGTAYYVISPAPITHRTGTFSAPWSYAETRDITLADAPTATITVTNSLSQFSGSGSRRASFGKSGTSWYLIAAQHVSESVITGVTLGSSGLEFTRSSIQVMDSSTASMQAISTTVCQ